jgi:hypothetical protein
MSTTSTHDPTVEDAPPEREPVAIWGPHEDQPSGFGAPLSPDGSPRLSITLEATGYCQPWRAIRRTACIVGALIALLVARFVSWSTEVHQGPGQVAAGRARPLQAEHPRHRRVAQRLTRRHRRPHRAVSGRAPAQSVTVAPGAPAPITPSAPQSGAEMAEKTESTRHVSRSTVGERSQFAYLGE